MPASVVSESVCRAGGAGGDRHGYAPEGTCRNWISPEAPPEAVNTS